MPTGSSDEENCVLARICVPSGLVLRVTRYTNAAGQRREGSWCVRWQPPGAPLRDLGDAFSGTVIGKQFGADEVASLAAYLTEIGIEGIGELD